MGTNQCQGYQSHHIMQDYQHHIIMVMSSKKHWRSNTVQEEGVINEGRHHLLLLRKQAHAKLSDIESQHVYIKRARITACELGVFSSNISTTLGNMPTPLFEEPLKFIAHWCIFGDYRIVHFIIWMMSTSASVNSKGRDFRLKECISHTFLVLNNKQ